MAKLLWPETFGPTYSPEMVAQLGSFEGRYWESVVGDKKNKAPANVKDWYKFDNVVSGSKEERDVELNKFNIKSRQDLSVWRKNGWLTSNSPFGHYQWFILFADGGRRGIKHDGKSEDMWQIGRWRSYIARHMGGIKARGKASDKQKQAMLQWYWNHEHAFTDKRVTENAKKMAKLFKAEICTEDEFMIEYGFKKVKKVDKVDTESFSLGGIYLGPTPLDW